MNIVVYTALFGDIDKLWSIPPVSIAGAKYVVFTEKKRSEVGLWTSGFGHIESRVPVTMLQGTGKSSPVIPTWEQVIVPSMRKVRKHARYFKTMVHEVLPDADVSVWVDANLRLLAPPKIALKWLQHRDLAAFRHPDRECLFREAEFCLAVKKGTTGKIRRQIEVYKQFRMPLNYGLASTRCVVRRHTKAQKKVNEAWWKEIQTYSVRDQISLPFVCWKLGLKWSVIPGYALHHEYFWFIKHRSLP